MRILVADQNALLLRGIASTFGSHCDMVVATRRDECVAHLRERPFDVVVACERLSDYTGLELLGEITALTPQTLRIFSAPPQMLKRLGPRLDFFGLLGTLSYPIDAHKLLLALKVARGKLAARHNPPKPQIRHVVLEESEWDTGIRLGLLERELVTAARAAGEVRVVDSSAWEESAATTGPAAAPTEEASFEEMPGAIAVARVVSTPTGAAAAVTPPVGTSQSRSVGAVHTRVPRAKVEASPRQDVKAVPPLGTPASGDLKGFLKSACNDPDIDAPLPVDTHGAANEPLFDNQPGKGARKAQDAIGKTTVPGTTAAPGKSAAAARTPEVPTGGVTAAAAPVQDSSKASAVAGRKTDDNNSDKQAAKGTSGAQGTSGSRGDAKETGSPAGGGAKKGAEKGPKVRKPTVPTAAQRQAFQRALARRNAARLGGGYDQGDFGSDAEATDAEAAGFGAEAGADAEAASFGTGAPDVTTAGFGRASGPGARREDAQPRGAQEAAAPAAGRSTPFISTQSLSDLAKMAGTKRPLKEFKRGTPQPKRRVLVYGSGVVAALLAVVIFQLTKATHSDHGHNQSVQEANAHLFGPSPAGAADGTSGSRPQIFTPTPPPTAAGAASLPQPQHFDPNTAPPDPPPPPAVEHPGPVEPPSQ